MQRRRRAEAAKGGAEAAEAGNEEEATKDRSAENAAAWRKWGGTKDGERDVLPWLLRWVAVLRSDLNTPRQRLI
jgi:hypothetical protein